MLELRTLGGLDLRRDDGKAADGRLVQPKRLALLTYVVLADTGGSRRRDAIIAYFWPELDTAHARAALRQALHFLRRSFGEGVLLTRGEEMVAVNPAAMWCDAVAFRQECAARRYDRALALYSGDFLDGFFAADVAVEFEQWIAETRTELRRRAIDCAWGASEEHRAAGDLRGAATLARRAVALGPDDEAGAARLIAVLDEAGDRAGALEAYDAFEARIRSGYDAAPSPETQALIGRVRARTVASDPPAAAPLPRAATPGPGPAPAFVPSHGTPPVARRRAPFIVTAVLATIVGIVAVAGRLPAREQPFSLAVVPLPLPLDDRRADTSRGYIADGVTEQLITDLGQLGTVRLVNRRTMMTYRHSTKTPAQIARELHVDGVMTGTLRLLGDTLRLSTQLVLTRDDRAICAQSLTGTRAALLRIQQNAARATAACIQRTLSTSGRQQMEVARPRTVNPEAVDAYIRGRYYWNERRTPSLHRSIALFTESLHDDPTFALAYSGLGDAYAQLGYTNGLAPGDAFPKARAAAERALTLDSSLAEPHATLGFVHLYYDWDWPAAEREFRRAIVGNPSYATAHEWYGLYLAAMGRFEDAHREEALAQELDPLSVAIAGTSAWVSYYAGDLPRAKHELLVALRADSTFALGHLYLGRVFQEQHESDSAMAHYRATGPLRAWVPTVAGDGNLLGNLGRGAEARAILARLDSMSRDQYVTAYGVALVHVGLHQTDSAFVWLERGYAERTNWMVWLNRDPRWSPIRADPRFRSITRRMRLPP